MNDVRDIIFKDIAGKKFLGALIPERDGCLSGVEDARQVADELGIELNLFLDEGAPIKKGIAIGEVIATPKNMAMAEEKVIGALSKFSGIATAAREAVNLADGKIEVVSGAWKKMPPDLKISIRMAILAGGSSFRVTQEDMIYLDKNYIKMLGSIPDALASVKDFPNHVKVIQIKGKNFSIEEETKQAIENGSELLMVDTGNIEDVNRCLKVVNELNIRHKVKIAFAGDIKLSQIPEMAKYDIDVIDIGKEIIDAPLLDIRLDVTSEA